MPSATNRTQLPFRPDLEGLRGVAVTLVVLFHAAVPGLAGGYVGVDVFYALSGFLVTRLLLAELQTTGEVEVARFYARRCRRLLPAALLVIAATLIHTALTQPALVVADVVDDALAATLYGANLRFAMRAVSYLDAGIDSSPLLHYWSLSIEEQFYVVWPLLLAGLARWWCADRVRVGGLALVGSVVSLTAALYLARVNQSHAFFLPVSRAWELGAGALLATLPLERLRLTPPFARVIGWLGLAAIVGCAVALTGHEPFPGWNAALPIAGTAAIIVAGVHPDAGWWRSPLEWTPLRRLGRISYSLYLWHWPVLAAATGTIAVDAAPGPMRRAVAIGIAVVLAAATTRWVERPFRHGAAGPRAVRVDLFASVGALAATCVLAVLAGEAVRLRGDVTQPRLSPPLASVRKDMPRPYQDGCHQGFKQSAILPCIYGAPAATRTMFLVGDSHAAQWFPALERAASTTGWRLVALTKSACPFIDVTMLLPAQGRSYDECTSFRRDVARRIARERPELVVVSSSFGGHLRADSGKEALGDQRRRLWSDGLGRMLHELRRDAARVVVIADSPRPLMDAPVCVARFGVDARRCRIDFARAVDAAAIADERAVTTAAAVELVDPTEWVCPGRQCAAVRDGTLVFRDDHHLTATFARKSSDRLARSLAL
jgi:peptidoglycan/LPS O-acetylase OafA/YrhL